MGDWPPETWQFDLPQEVVTPAEDRVENEGLASEHVVEETLVEVEELTKNPSMAFVFSASSLDFFVHCRVNKINNIIVFFIKSIP